MKYGIDWGKENAVDGGYYDNGAIVPFLDDERNYSEQDIERGYAGNFNAVVYNCYARMDKNTKTLYLILKLCATRKGSNSVLSVILESDILDKRIEETIEMSKGIKSAIPEVRITIPVKSEYNESLCPSDKKYVYKEYNIDLRYKDNRMKEYRAYGENGRAYAILQPISDYEDIKLDSENMVIQYGYMDVVRGFDFVPIKGVETYQKEDGTWTSDVVVNPEKYLKSDLDWYYSDERMVDYIEAKGLLPQDKIYAIRAANYEDIFSFEYKMKSAIKIIPIVLVMIIIAIIVIKKIRKRIF